MVNSVVKIVVNSVMKKVVKKVVKTGGEKGCETGGDKVAVKQVTRNMSYICCEISACCVHRVFTTCSPPFSQPFSQHCSQPFPPHVPQ